MREEWWGRPACFIRDNWWALLLVIVLALVAYFTRGYWFPMVRIYAAVAPAVTSTPGGSTVVEFVDPQGIHTIFYPSNWST